MPGKLSPQLPASISLAEILATAARNLKNKVKRKGELAESFFQFRALALGFFVSKLWGDSSPADFILQSPTWFRPPALSEAEAAGKATERRLVLPSTWFRPPSAGKAAGRRLLLAPPRFPSARIVRIQVKSAWTIVKGGYKINTVTNGAGRHTYRPDEIDFYACIAMPLGVTYLVPVTAVKPGQPCFFLFPTGPKKRRSDCRMPSYEKFRERWDLLQ